MAIDADDFAYVRTLCRDRSGIVLEEGKEYLVEARLTPVAAQAGYVSLHDLITQLRHPSSQALQRQVVEALAIHETQFFRDGHPFDTLKAAILPELIAKRAASRQLNLWCAAASSGQEPYSVAMLLVEHFPHLADWRVQLIASDISDTVVAQAQQGNYSQVEVMRGLPASLLEKHFHRQGGNWRISEQIRRQVAFQTINLIHAWPPLPPMDIILLRNVLIYFEVDTRKSILARVRQLLKPDGYLFLGSAETTINVDSAFEKVQFDKTVCYQLRP